MVWRKTIKLLWLGLALLTIVLGIYPIEYRVTKVAFVIGVVATSLGGLVFYWPKRWLRYGILAVWIMSVGLVCLPGRPAAPEELAQTYTRMLRKFDGVRYVWGGESYFGIDCSGLVRKSMIWAQLIHGARTLNGDLIREAMRLWWFDCSAMALRDGYRGWTREIAARKSIEATDPGSLRPGDLAITGDGVHVLAYLGQGAWIQADPGVHRVVEVTLPTEMQWFKIPVVMMRWKWLEEGNQVELPTAVP